MVVGEKPDWRPEKYSNTKRGQKAKRALGTSKQSSQANQSQSLFAPQKTAPKATGTGTNTGTGTGTGTGTDTGTKSLPGFGGSAMPKTAKGFGGSDNSGFAGQTNNKAPKRTVPSSLMTASMDEITGLLAGIDKRKSANSQQGPANQPNQPNQTGATSNFLAGMKASAGPQKKSPLPAQNKPKEKDDRQPQYRLTGKASVQLGGPDDGKVTMLDDDLMPIAEKRQQDNNSTNDAHGLNKAERKQHNARTDADHRTAREKQREADPKWDNRSGARKIYDGLAKLADVTPERFGELADRAPKRIKEALVKGAEAVTSDEMKKGTGFGFRAAGEVVKEAAMTAAIDALLAHYGGKLDLDTIQSLYLSGGTQGLQGSKGFHLGYEDIAKDLAKRINNIKTDVYGDN